MTATNANDLLFKSIVSIVVKKGGIKLVDLAKIISDETKTKVLSKDLKPVVSEMFNKQLVDLIEYKTPTGEDNKIFLVPTNTKVVHGGEDAADENVKALDDAAEVEEQIILPEDMITQYAVVTKDGVESFEDREVAAGAFLLEKGKAKDAEAAGQVALYGLIPIKLDWTTSLNLPSLANDSELDVLADEIGGQQPNVPDLTANAEADDSTDGDDDGDADPFKA